ncbi:uncharacterized protein METZ01_LOCUS381460 [marine metagenome]|uniref:MobA-like NTP transferase domain-containing protein n=1 Tax=marine metagenome TaxID=408172 RepID=A0A382U2R1_9ZZZZ
MKKNVVGIIQARMGATRLPGKMMLPLRGIPVVEWVFRRMEKASLVNNIVFAIPETKENNILDAHLKKIGATVYRGSEKDVVERFYFAAKELQATHAVRVCADNPFISGSEIDRLVAFYFKSNCDYAYNHIPKKNCYPNGIGAEIVSFEILKTIYEEAKSIDHREHVLNFIWAHSDRFKILTFDPVDKSLAHPEIKLDIDSKQDYEKLSRMDVSIEMDAHQILAAAKALE